MNAMEERHAVEREELKQKQALGAPKIRFSKESLNLRKIEETLAKQREYSEAQRIKGKADALESAEIEAARAVRPLHQLWLTSVDAVAARCRLETFVDVALSRNSRYRWWEYRKS